MSKQLGLRLAPEGEMLRLLDAQTGEPILTKNERIAQMKQQAEQSTRQAEQASQRIAQYTRRADVAAADLVRLRVELERRRRIRRSGNP